MRLYPLFLKLQGKKVVLVGGGAMAIARLPALLDAGATVTVVAPEVRADIGPVRVLRRAFEPADLDGAWLAIAASTAAVNRQVYDAGMARRIFANSVDDPDTASAFAGGTFHRDGLSVSISTEGQAPALAGLLREAFESIVPDDYAGWIETARSLRSGWKAKGIPIPNRRPLLLEALNQRYEVKS